jgi:uncharacterized membrane-anchored protein
VNVLALNQDQRPKGAEMKLNLTPKELFFVTVACENIIKAHKNDSEKETIEMISSLRSATKHMKAIILDKKEIKRKIKMSILTMLRRNA